MQLIITRGLYDYRGVQYVDDSFGVAKIPGLNLDDTGLPIRWSFDGPAGSGFSDHLPIYAKFVTVPDNRTDRYISLRNPSEDTGLASVNKVEYAAINLAQVALKLDQLPTGSSLRDEKYIGKIVQIVGEVRPGRGLSVMVRNDVYDVWSFDPALRQMLRDKYKEGDNLRFYGELNQYKGRWQFVIRDPSLVKWKL